MADISITGLNQLSAALSNVAPRLAKNALAAGMRQAANIVKDQAKTNFNGAGGPTDLTGDLKRSISTVQRRGTQDRVVFNVVAGKLTTAQINKYGRDSPYYALWVEKGHINRKMHDALFGMRRFKAYQRQVSESNTPAHPYMAPALQSKAQEAVDACAQMVIERFEAAVAGVTYLESGGGK